MRAAAILGPGSSLKNLAPFQINESIEWFMGMPSDPAAVDAIILFGGDGTVHRHLSQLVRLALPALVVPVGSGNDFARALGLRTVRAAHDAWAKFCADTSALRTIDLGIITPLGMATAACQATATAGMAPSHTPRFFCCVAGVGIDAEVSRRANRLPRWLRGHGGYTLSLLPAMAQFAPVRVKIQILGESISTGAVWQTLSDQPIILAAFANTPTYGGGMKIAPHAQMDDGLLDLCIVGALNPLKLFRLFPTVYFGRHLQVREVQYLQAARLRLETEFPLDVYADGEFVCRTPVEISVQRAALRVITLEIEV
jgi:diacylglycerol kinase (ATP)